MWCRNRSPLVRLPLETHSRDVPSSQCSRDLSRSSISSCPFSLCVENFDVTHGCLGIKAQSQPTKLHRERKRERERESHPSPSTLFIKIGIATQASWNYTADSSILLPTNSPNYHPRSIREDVLAHVSVKKQEDGSLDEIRNEIKRGTKVCFACHPYSRT